MASNFMLVQVQAVHSGASVEEDQRRDGMSVQATTRHQKVV